MIVKHKNIDQNCLKGLPGYTVKHVHCSPALSWLSVVNMLIILSTEL
jgi:hypothetical protein